MPYPPLKKILNRLCKQKNSDKHIKKTYLCSSGNELLNFFPPCVFFFIKNDFKLEISKKMFYYETKASKYCVTV